MADAMLDSCVTREWYNKYHREYHRRRREQGLCVICGTPSMQYYCERHMQDHRARKARVRAFSRRRRQILAEQAAREII